METICNIPVAFQFKSKYKNNVQKSVIDTETYTVNHPKNETY